jgi:hypothetical protein
MELALNLLYYITQWMTEFLWRMEAYFKNVLAITMEYITAIIHSIYVMLDETIRSINSALQIMVQSVEAAMTQLITSITIALDGLWQRITETTIYVIDQIGAYVQNILARLGVLFDNVLGRIDVLVQNIIVRVQGVLTAIIGNVGQALETIVRKISSLIEGQLNLGERMFDTLTGKLDKGLDTLIGGADSLVSQIGERLGDIREGFSDVAANLIEKASGIDEHTFQPIRDSLKSIFEGLTNEADATELQVMSAKFQDAMQTKDPAKLRNWVHSEWMQRRPTTSPFWTSVFFTIMGALGGVFTLMGVAQASSEVWMQDFRKEYPYQLLAPMDATGAWRRGLLSTQETVDMIQRQGYAEQLAKTILDLSEFVPPEQDLFSMYHRGLISEQDLRGGLFEKGVKDEMIDPLIQASYVLPPVADIITMAVREVFTPAVAERFGQYEDFPKPFADEAEKQGLTVEWARRYWAAHWALPSPQQGFEMLHRGVIGTEDLNLLLKSLDVMPFWRDRLTQIAYAPFTRVDIRRMHKVGVLDEQGVKLAYKDLGYNEEKASTLTEFTLRLNAPKDADDAIELESLSRASILGFYSDGLLTRERAKGLLLGLGYSDEAATSYLDSEDIQEERRERQEEITLIIELAKAGTITFENAQDQLNALGLEESEIKKTLVKLIRAEKSQTKLPSRSEAERMVKAKVLELKDYTDLLERLGYSKKWREAFTALLLGDLENGKES